MTATAAGLPGEAAPANYRQLAEEYSGKLRRLVRRQLAHPTRPGNDGGSAPYVQVRAEDVDDTVQYILAKFVENDVIAQFDPGHVSGYTRRPVRFEAFIMSKAVLYCRGKREELGRRAGRELQVLDTEPEDSRSPWIEAFIGRCDDYGVLDDDEVWQRMRDHVAAVPAEPGARPLLPLLEHLAEALAEGRPTGPEGVRRAFGLTRKEAGDYHGALAGALRGLRLGADRVTHELGGMTLTQAELLAHIEALKASPGHHVVAIWKRAGLKLAAAGKEWYLPVAREEQRLHPESRQPSGANVPGGRASPVKYALIRALERMLTSVATTPVPPPPAPAPAPPAPDLSALEASLRALPGATDAKVAAVLDAARAAFEEET